ncbi:hypothetical protein Pint_34557 [Pistacia integerrima]|uniref:Uncharacterized protein n=1 Tax=Pistacia integerrima TaxID=434235 RepID=A0ACC0X8Q0_9ROSI|nr:hypothetical protein Pint_34557 [Pistacia integerrima]
MGNCAISPSYRKGNGGNNNNNFKRPLTVKIIHLDGRLQEFREPIEARNVLSQNPNCYLCSSESMFIGSQVPHLAKEEQLQQGQIYFLMPLSKSQAPLTLQDLCSLAIKASSALPKLTPQPPFKYQVVATPPPAGFCEVPTGFQVPARR